MTQALPLRCRCGTMRGVLSDVEPRGKRAVCYCDDCQIYAHQLGREDMLDERGGTDALVSTPAQLRITEGEAQLRCMRLGPKGLYRWYAGCCSTPLGNTLGPGLPALIIPLVAFDFESAGVSAEQAMGAPAARMMARFARGGVPAGAHAKVPPGMMLKIGTHLLGGLLRGKARPSPFFDAQGKPRVEPVLADRAKREASRAQILARV